MVRTFKLGIATFVAVVLTLCAAAGATSASMKSTSQHCATVVEKIPGQHGKSRMVSQQCSRSEPLGAPINTTLLVTFYEFPAYGGDSDDVYGRSGPCDGDGYGLSDLSGVDNAIGGISSYIYSNSCNEQDYFQGTDYTGFDNVNRDDCPFVGELWDHNLFSMQLWWQF